MKANPKHPTPNTRLIVLAMAFLCCGIFYSQTTIKGEQRIWHPTTLLFDGPQTAEDSPNNPFLNFRFNVTFIAPSGNSYLVPGYFAADGDAANSGASSGNKWAVHFTPDEIGTWTYSVSFRTGNAVAVSLLPEDGIPVSFDGTTAEFEVLQTNKTLPDNRAKGRLNYVGERYLKFEGNNSYFIKVGADSPENLLAHKDFDNAVTPKDWSDHLQDWEDGDPVWQTDKGKGLIGAVNYLSSKGMNAFAFNMFNLDDPQTNNDGGDRTIWPWSSDNIPLMEGSGTLSEDSRMRYDVSKLAQWEILFEHADSKGMFLHFKTQERGNLKLLDDGDLGVQRKLYYREIIARFGHHLALNWNLGEEFHIYDPALVNRLSSYIKAVDPYDHLIVLHTFPGQQDRSYTPLLGTSDGVSGASLQIDINKIHGEVKKWNEASRATGKPWVVSSDEQGHWSVGVTVDEAFDGNHGTEPDNRSAVRHRVLWGTLMAGGFGVEYYFGTKTGETDWSSENWRSRATKWEDAKIAYDFFNDYLNFWEMESRDSLTNYSQDYCLAKEGELYAIYLPGGSSTELDLRNISGEFQVQWFNPREGGALSTADIGSISGGAWRSIGNPPGDISQDWVALVKSLDNSVIPVTGIQLQPALLSLEEGEVFTLTKEIIPLNATHPIVSWSSDNPDVASVDQSGRVTALIPGNATISVVTEDGDYIATSNIEVIPNTAINSILGFTLVNAVTNTDLLLLTDNRVVILQDVLNSALNIRANVSGEEVQSVEMMLSGPINRNWTEHQAPFSLFGDQEGDYYGGTFAEGTYILSATPYSGVNSSGEKGETKTIQFTISATPTTSNLPPQAIVTSSVSHGESPLIVEFDGSHSVDDQGIVAYFWDFGDGNTASAPTVHHIFNSPGTYTVQLVVTDAAGLTATASISVSIFPDAPDLTSKFILVSADTNYELFELKQNMQIYTDSLPQDRVNIRADIPGEAAKSVRFILNGEITRSWTANKAPFMLFGGHSDNNMGQILPPGHYRLLAEAYSEPALGGRLLEKLKIDFRVIPRADSRTDEGDSLSNLQTEENQLQSNKNAIRLHPNPASVFINAEIIEGSAELTKLLLYNISGSLVKTYLNPSILLQEEGVYKIDTSTLSSGIYLLKVYTNSFNTYHYKLAVKSE